MHIVNSFRAIGSRVLAKKTKVCTVYEPKQLHLTNLLIVKNELIIKSEKTPLIVQRHKAL